MSAYSLFFEDGQPFNLRNVRSYKGTIGLYFIYNQTIAIQYPFAESRLIYIGMSEKRTNSVGNRLQGHLEGKTGNEGISNYAKANSLLFTVVNFQMVRAFWPLSVESLESYFISDFLRNYGVYPICNNKTGTNVRSASKEPQLQIDWNFFEHELQN